MYPVAQPEDSLNNFEAKDVVWEWLVSKEYISIVDLFHFICFVLSS
jgi:hypothetical protein